MGKEELNLLIAELPQFRAENKVDAHMFSIPTTRRLAHVARYIDHNAYARYATVNAGSLLKCSESMKRSSRFQLMEAVSSIAWVRGWHLSSSGGH